MRARGQQRELTNCS